jgi:CubicO group peptidase (beta-lactamase class C family)
MPKRTFIAALVILAASGSTSMAAAQAAPAQASEHAAAAVNALDSLMSAGMKRDRIIGGAYVIVAGGRIAASRGFGVADMNTLRRVHPDSTVFGLASTTKLLTAIAAVRLANGGVVGLDAAIDPYFAGTSLTDRVKGATLARLLTHTAGYDDPTIGSAAKTAKDVVPPARYLERALSRPWIAPRTVTAYSNVGVALAGHTLELASAMSFAQLIDSTVLAPYGMTRTSASQPLPAGLEAMRATPYSAFGGEQRVVPRIYFNDAPASAAYATPHDMGLLMEHLLAPRTSADSAVAAMLFSRRFTNHPALPGVSLGFVETTDGPGVFEHGGDWQDYSNEMYLDRANGIGLFAVFSSGEGGRVAREMWHALHDRYAGPKPPFVTPPASMMVPRCQEHFGTYRDTRMSRHTIARLGILTGDIREMVVRINTGIAEVDKRVYRELGDGAMRSDDGRMLAFRCGDGKGATYGFRADAPLTSYRRISRFETRRAQTLFILGALLLTLVALAFDVRRGSRERVRSDGTVEKPDFVDGTARVVRLIAAVIMLLFVIGIGYLLATTDPWSFQYGLPVRVAQLVSVFRYVALGALVAVLVTLVAVMRPRSTTGFLRLLLAVPVLLLAGLLYQYIG